VDGSSIKRRALKWSLGALAVLIVGLLVLIAAAALVDANHLRGFLVRTIQARTGRQIRIDGPLEVHLLSRTPSVIAEQVSIGNPPWMPPGSTAEIGRLSFSFDFLSFFSPSFALRRLEMQNAALHLVRDADGHANWQAHAPGSGRSTGPPIIHSLSAPNAHVQLDDARRQLKFDGTVSALEPAGAAAAPPLRIEGSGQLNGRPVTFDLNADPLALVTQEQPYGFTFVERSSGSRLSVRGTLPQPFDFHLLDSEFEASGEDLKDLYFLTGISMPNTGAYHLSGKVTRRGSHFRYSDLLVTSGQSDLRGVLSIETSRGHARIEGQLSSQLLRTADLGARAAGRDPVPESMETLLLPDTALPLTGIRRGDAVLDYHAQRFELGRTTLHALAAHVTIDHEALVIAPLSAAFPEGRISGRATFDATPKEPMGDVDFRITDLRLGQFDRKGKGPPPLDGMLQARVVLKGHGESLHQLAADSSGRITIALPQGAIRASFAELTGMDLARGLGMMLSKDHDEAVVHCGFANFEARDGILTAQNLLIDSDPVLITGTGQIHLDSETLDLALHGRPKSLRLLRWHSPVVIRGTLKHPSTGIDTHKAALTIVDRGSAQQVDCAALLTQAKAAGLDIK
jgi:AsmA family protein